MVKSFLLTQKESTLTIYASGAGAALMDIFDNPFLQNCKKLVIPFKDRTRVKVKNVASVLENVKGLRWCVKDCEHRADSMSAAPVVALTGTLYV
jgi:hypothetical protein